MVLSEICLVAVVSAALAVRCMLRAALCDVRCMHAVNVLLTSSAVYCDISEHQVTLDCAN